MLNFVDSHNSPLRFAQLFRQIGWSILPLWGSVKPEKAKVCALPSWKAYQSRIATEHEITDWFAIQKHQAIGIVLGTVSRLVVLDIDDPQRAEAFANLLPDLTDTFTVRSGFRQLPHYYFQLPADLNVTSRIKDGVELRSDGQYVVAPCTSVEDRTWQITNQQKPRNLTERDLRRILAFMGCIPHSCAPKPEKRLSVRNNNIVEADSESDTATISPVQLLRRYHALASEVGRNNALFSVTCLARDCGWSKSRTESVMVMAHVQQKTVKPHVTESQSQRRVEALATIASVYSREPQQRAMLKSSTFDQLPNAIREKLLQLKLDKVARVFDALLMAGFKFGDLLNPADVYSAIGHYGIGRNTVYEALKATVDDCPLFTTTQTASPEPPSPSANAVNRFAMMTNQCLIGRVAKSGKIRGRKKLHYIMPSMDDLCTCLNLTNANVTTGDILPETALASPSAYRQALHSALIKRAPGQYSRKWQSERLGVSKDSLRRYEKCANMIVQAMYRIWNLGWHNLNNVVPDEPLDGHFVEDDRGNRYPPIMQLIRGLLARGRRLFYKVQVTNFYAMPIAQEIEVSHSHLEESTNIQVDIPLRIASFMPSPNVTSGDISDGQLVSARSESENAIANASHQTATPHRRESPNVTTGDISPNAIDDTQKQALAEQVYDTLRKLNPKRSLTRGHIKRLVEEYDWRVIQRGLKMVSRKRDLRNPAGFLLMWLRAQKWNENGASKPEIDNAKMPIKRAVKSAESNPTKTYQPQSVNQKDESHEAYLQRLKASPYVDYFINADQVLDA